MFCIYMTLYLYMYYGFSAFQQVMTSVLSRLSAWSEDGVQVPQEMLQKIVDMAKQTSLGKKALLHLVREWRWKFVNI